MVALDERINRCLPSQRLFILWIRESCGYLREYFPDIYQDAVVCVVSARPQLARVINKKRDEDERKRVTASYIRTIMERAAWDSIPYYKNSYSMPARHEYMKTTPAFVPDDAPAKRMYLDDDRVTLTASTPTEEDILFQIELERVEVRLSTDAKTLLGMLINRFYRREILEIMDITLGRYRTLMEELRRELKFLLNKATPTRKMASCSF